MNKICRSVTLGEEISSLVERPPSFVILPPIGQAAPSFEEGIAGLSKLKVLIAQEIGSRSYSYQEIFALFGLWSIF